MVYTLLKELCEGIGQFCLGVPLMLYSVDGASAGLKDGRAKEECIRGEGIALAKS